MKLVTGDFNKYVAPWNDHTFARLKSVSIVVVVVNEKEFVFPIAAVFNYSKEIAEVGRREEKEIFFSVNSKREREREREGEKRYDFKENSLGCARINTRIAVN